jgi:hypothetical protein
LYCLRLKLVQERKKRGVPVDDSGDVYIDMMLILLNNFIHTAQ